MQKCKNAKSLSCNVANLEDCKISYLLKGRKSQIMNHPVCAGGYDRQEMMNHESLSVRLTKFQVPNQINN